MDASNLNMINWAAALRGNRRKGVALLEAMLADPVQRDALCADPDALSLIFGYGPDDPLAQAARGIPASAVVCYVNSRYGTEHVDLAGIVADGELLTRLRDSDEAARTMLWGTAGGVEAVFANSIGVAATVALALQLDRYPLAVAPSALAATSGSEEGDALMDALFSDTSKTIGLIKSQPYMEAGLGSARWLNRVCRDDRARKQWSKVRLDADVLVETLDSAPEGLFEKHDIDITGMNEGIYSYYPSYGDPYAVNIITKDGKLGKATRGKTIANAVANCIPAEQIDILTFMGVTSSSDSSLRVCAFPLCQASSGYLQRFLPNSSENLPSAFIGGVGLYNGVLSKNDNDTGMNMFVALAAYSKFRAVSYVALTEEESE